MRLNFVFAFAFAFSLLTASCSTMNNLSGMGIVSQSDDKFNGSHDIYVTPNHVADAESSYNFIKMGASWNSQKKDAVRVIVQYNGIPGSAYAYAAINGISVRIDGIEKSFKSAGTTSLDSTNYGVVGAPKSTTSANVVLMDLDYLRKMTASRDVKVRVHTSKADMDCLFDKDKNGGGPLAQSSLRLFVAAVDAYQAGKK